MRNTKHNYTIDELKEVVSKSYSYAECLRHFYIPTHGSMYTTLKHRIKTNNIDISHFTGARWNAGKVFGPKPRIEIADILSNKIEYTNSSTFRKRLIREGYFEEKCYAEGCGLTSWLGKPIMFHLDHINGDHYDNRLENLTILCPNCHTQTPTYGSKNAKLKRIASGKKTIIERRKEKHIEKTIFDINNRKAKIKKERPRKFSIDKETLEKLVWQKSTIKVANELGVTDKAVEKRCKLLGIKKPPRGYWMKNKSQL
jgi:5-methylcytosine-specific restriction endonuclease McrA